MGYKDRLPILEQHARKNTPEGWFPSASLVPTEVDSLGFRAVLENSPKSKLSVLLIVEESEQDESGKPTWTVQCWISWMKSSRSSIEVKVDMTTTELQQAFSEERGNIAVEAVFERSDDCLSLPAHQLGIHILLNSETCDAVTKLLSNRDEHVAEVEEACVELGLKRK